MSDELLPCPFCGGEASRIASRQRDDGTYYPAACGCRKCGIWRYGESDYGHGGFATKEDRERSMKQAIEAWNTRANDAPEQPVDNAQADSRERLEADMRTTIETLKSNSSLVDFLSGGKYRGLAEDIAVNAWEIEQLCKDILAKYDMLHEAIDAMNNGQFYAMYKAKCDECEEAVSFAKRLENAVNDGQPVTLFGVDYFTKDICDECANMYLHETKMVDKQNKKLLAEHEQLLKKLKRLRRRLAKAKKERDHLKTVVKTQAESFKKLEAELSKARSNQ